MPHRIPETATTTSPRFPAAFWVVVAGTFINRFGTFVMPFLPLLLTRRGFSPGEAGLAVSAYGCGALFAAGLGGWLADRIGRNVTMALALFAGGGSMFAMVFAVSVPQVVALATLAGLLGEALGPALNALVQDIIPGSQRLAAYAVLRIAVNAGFAFGPAVAGILAEKNLAWVFGADALSSMIFGAMAVFFLPRGHSCGKTDSGWGPALASLRRHREYLALAASTIVISLVLRQSVTALSLAAKALGYSGLAIGLLFGINGILIITCELTLTRATRHWPMRGTIAAGFAIIGAGLALNAAGPWWWLPAVSMIVLTGGEMLCLSRTSAYAAALSPVDMRGRYSGALSVCWWLGYIAGGAPGLVLFEKDPALVWWGCGLLGLIAAAVMLAGRSRKDSGSAPETILAEPVPETK